MGLGRLNPGGSCGCVGVPSDPCKRAAYFLGFSRATLTSPVISMTGGYYVYAYNNLLQLCAPATFVPNAGSVAVIIPPWQEAICDGYILDEYGLSTLYIDPVYIDNYPQALWPISTIGDCQFALTNYNANSDLLLPNSVGRFEGSFNFGYGFGTLPSMTVVVQHSVVLAQSVSQFFTPPGEMLCDIDYPLFTGIAPVGANYFSYGNQSFPYHLFFQELSNPSRASSVRVDMEYISPINGCGLNTNCDGGSVCWLLRRITTMSAYNILLYGGQREFELWQPSPPIDPWGLLNQECKLTFA